MRTPNKVSAQKSSYIHRKAVLTALEAYDLLKIFCIFFQSFRKYSVIKSSNENQFLN